MNEATARVRTALVTGGARGIGCEVAGQLHAAGWNVAIADLQLPDSKEMSEDARLAHFFHVQMDVADTQSGTVTPIRTATEIGRAPSRERV